ncbi:MAG: nuclear transport factor 2 family protein, partial [Acidobacteriota bacterium]|nr:nuclear transport factor 2 family protein [Acidobacteriota bacterium]
YMTIWRRQADGNYKAVIDFGISHPKPETVETNWKSPSYIVKNAGENKPVASNAVNLFYDTAAEKGLSSAYKMFAADDVRLLRDEQFPILGKGNAVFETKKDKSKIDFGVKMTLQSAGDFAYALTTFEIKTREKTTAKGNSLQIWKLRGGKWQIVLDVMNRIQTDKS